MAFVCGPILLDRPEVLRRKCSAPTVLLGVARSVRFFSPGWIPQLYSPVTNTKPSASRIFPANRWSCSGAASRRKFLIHSVEYRKVDCLGIDQFDDFAAAPQPLNDEFGEADTHPIGTIRTVKNQDLIAHCRTAWMLYPAFPVRSGMSDLAIETRKRMPRIYRAHESHVLGPEHDAAEEVPQECFVRTHTGIVPRAFESCRVEPQPLRISHQTMKHAELHGNRTPVTRCPHSMDGRRTFGSP